MLVFLTCCSGGGGRRGEEGEAVTSVAEGGGSGVDDSFASVEATWGSAGRERGASGGEPIVNLPSSSGW